MPAIRIKRKLLVLKEKETQILSTLRDVNGAHIQYVEDGVVYLEDLVSDKAITISTATFNSFRVNRLIAHEETIHEVQIWRISEKGVSVLTKLLKQD